MYDANAQYQTLLRKQSDSSDLGAEVWQWTITSMSILHDNARYFWMTLASMRERECKKLIL
jgi:hypothetical protein